LPTKPKTFRPAGQPEPKERRRRFDKVRTETQPWRKWYCSARWMKNRLIFLNRSPLCVDCQKAGKVQPATDVDHIIPHRGDEALFWQVSNWQALCRSCHSRKTGRGQ